MSGTGSPCCLKNSANAIKQSFSEVTGLITPIKESEAEHKRYILRSEACGFRGVIDVGGAPVSSAKLSVRSFMEGSSIIRKFIQICCYLISSYIFWTVFCEAVCSCEINVFKAVFVLYLKITILRDSTMT